MYAHYEDKLDLFHAVVERAGAAFDLDLKPAGPEADHPEEALGELLVEVLGATTDPQALALIRILIIESLRRPELGRLLDESLWDELIGVAASLLEADAARNQYELPDGRTYALQLLRMASASLTLDCLLSSGFEPDQKLLETHAEWVVALFLRGIRPRSERARWRRRPRRITRTGCYQG